MDEELKFFKDKMRDLTVPQCLPSGKLSTRPQKTVHVSGRLDLLNYTFNGSLTISEKRPLTG